MTVLEKFVGTPPERYGVLLVWSDRTFETAVEAFDNSTDSIIARINNVDNPEVKDAIEAMKTMKSVVDGLVAAAGLTDTAGGFASVLLNIFSAAMSIAAAIASIAASLGDGETADLKGYFKSIERRFRTVNTLLESKQNIAAMAPYALKAEVVSTSDLQTAFNQLSSNLAYALESYYSRGQIDNMLEVYVKLEEL